jgi:hypothetical protein
MEPPSSDAEALRAQQPAPVRASHGFLVTADEAGHLEGREQPVGQALPILRLAAADELIVDPNPFRIRVQIPHGRLRDFALIGIGRRAPARMTNSQGGASQYRAGAAVSGRTSREAPRVSDRRYVDH